MVVYDLLTPAPYRYAKRNYHFHTILSPRPSIYCKAQALEMDSHTGSHLYHIIFRRNVSLLDVQQHGH